MGDGIFSCRIDNAKVPFLFFHFFFPFIFFFFFFEKIVSEILSCLCSNDRKGSSCEVEVNNEGLLFLFFFLSYFEFFFFDLAVIFSVEGKGKSYQVTLLLSLYFSFLTSFLFSLFFFFVFEIRQEQYYLLNYLKNIQQMNQINQRIMKLF